MCNVFLHKSSCFQLLFLRHLTFHKVVYIKIATHLRCGGIFSDTIITNNFSPDSNSEIILKNRLIFDEVKA